MDIAVYGRGARNVGRHVLDVISRSRYDRAIRLPHTDVIYIQALVTRGVGERKHRQRLHSGVGLHANALADLARAGPVAIKGDAMYKLLHDDRLLRGVSIGGCFS